MFVTLRAQQSGNDLILSWPTNVTGYTLQSAPDLNSPVSWTDSTNTPAIVGASFAITNSAAADSRFYRLKR